MPTLTFLLKKQYVLIAGTSELFNLLSFSALPLTLQHTPPHAPDPGSEQVIPILGTQALGEKEVPCV